jgi:hypothetical protein
MVAPSSACSMARCRGLVISAMTCFSSALTATASAHSLYVEHVCDGALCVQHVSVSLMSCSF